MKSILNLFACVLQNKIFDIPRKENPTYHIS